MYPLTTSRLQLRAFTRDDYPRLRELTQMPAIIDVLTDWAFDDAALERHLAWWLADYAAPPASDPAYWWAICTAESGCVIGWIGIWPKPGLDPAWPELTYALDPAWRGQGLAQEAAHAACRAVFAAHPELSAIQAIALAHNQASQRLLARCGFLSRGTRQIKDEGEFDYWLLPRPDLLDCFAPQLLVAQAGQAGELAVLQRQAFAAHAARHGAWCPPDGDAAGPGGHGEEATLAYLIASTDFRVLHAGGVLLGGVAVLGPVAGAAYVEYLFIDPAFGRQRLGQTLLALLEAALPEVAHWSVTTSAYSPDNLRFYQRCGYQLCGEDERASYFVRELAPLPQQPHWRRDLAEVGAVWQNCDLAQLTVHNANLEHARFWNVNLDGAQIHDANLTGLRIGEARLGGVQLAQGSWGGALLRDLRRGDHGDVAPVIIERCDLGGATLRDCDLRAARIEGGQLDGLLIDGVPYSELRAAWLAARMTS